MPDDGCGGVGGGGGSGGSGGSGSGGGDDLMVIAPMMKLCAH